MITPRFDLIGDWFDSGSLLALALALVAATGAASALLERVREGARAKQAARRP